jgi:Flp pilus assembly protein TadD
MSSSCSWRCGLLRQAAETWRRGMDEFRRGDAALAESMQRKALSLVFGLGGFPVLRARIHNNVGFILSCSGRGEEARREFSQALALAHGRVDPGTRFYQVLARNLHTAVQQSREQSSTPAKPAAQAQPAAA